MFTIKFNRQKKTYTIRHYINGVLVAKYRSLPQGSDFDASTWTQADIKAWLRENDCYYLVKK